MGVVVILLLLVLFAIVGSAIFSWWRHRNETRMRKEVRNILATYIPLHDLEPDEDMERGLRSPLTQI
jgi:hypothetical protein